jgi:uncharacterized protein
MKKWVFLILLIPSLSFALTNEELGHEMKKRFYTQDEEIRFTLVNWTGKNAEPEKEILVKRMTTGKDQYFSGKIVKPLNLKNTGLTAHVKNSEPQVWVYLPSSKQVRRIQSNNSGSGQILGSELSIEDLQFQNSSGVPLQIKKAETKSGKKIFLVEADVRKNSKLYSKVRSWVTEGDYTTIKTECYDKKNRLLKVIEFGDYKQVKNVLRPHKITVKNLQNNKRSEITVAETKVNLGRSPADFNPQAMAR